MLPRTAGLRHLTEICSTVCTVAVERRPVFHLAPAGGWINGGLHNSVIEFNTANAARGACSTHADIPGDTTDLFRSVFSLDPTNAGCAGRNRPQRCVQTSARAITSSLEIVSSAAVVQAGQC